MSIGILACGSTPPELFPRFGDYAGMVGRLLGPGYRTRTFDAAAGELPEDAGACAAYVLTGSAAGVYDDLPWIAPLLGFLRRARGQAPLVGLCFGHQAMATAFGGRVEKSAKGWSIGLHEYQVVQRTGWMDGAGRVRVPASHQDQVVELPPGARVVASSEFTPYAALDYGDAISFQFHPEFRADFGTALVESRRARFGALADAAIASYAGTDDCARVGGWIDRFLSGAVGAAAGARRPAA